MRNKLQELTEKIYDEGVGKANNDAKKIIAEAEDKANEIISNALAEQKRIVEEARKEAEGHKKTIESEILMSTKQALMALKQQITELIITGIINKPTQQALDDTAFVKDIIEKCVIRWTTDSSIDATVSLPADASEKMDKIFKKKFKQLLNNGLEINFNNTIKSGFRIGPKDGSYIISFTDDDFINFFKQFLRPRTKKMLFENEK